MATTSALEASNHKNQDSLNASSDINKAIDKANANVDKYAAKYTTEGIMNSEGFVMNARNLECPRLEGDIRFTKLRARLVQFYINAQKFLALGATPSQLETMRKTGFSMDYRIALHKQLKKLMREVICAPNPDQQNRFLKETYDWYFGKLAAMGALSIQEQEEEFSFTNPIAHAFAQGIRSNVLKKIQKNLVDEDFMLNHNKKLFKDERSIHPEVPPAKVRIQNYKHKGFGNSYSSAVEKINELPCYNHKWGSRKRPTTQQRDDVTTKSEAMTEATTQASSTVTARFEQSERAVHVQPFAAYYTTSDPVVYKDVNKFEGRSNYFHYYPTEEKAEQQLEKFWFEAKNKELQDKRLNEECKQIMNQWSEARGRMESEIARRKEHSNFATNFEQARGFVRTNWKTKNYNPEDDFMNQETSSDESDHQHEEGDSESKRASAMTTTKQPDLQENIAEEDNENSGDEDPTSPKTNNMEQNLLFNKGFSQSAPRMSKRIALQAKNVQVVDINKNEASKPDVETQLRTLRAIQAYNMALPESKRARDSLPLIKSCNIGLINKFMNDPKKKELVLVPTFHQIGIIDGGEKGKENKDVFSLSAKVRRIQKHASQNRIDVIRKHYSSLLGLKEQEPDHDGVMNPFLRNLAPEQEISLSVYNGVKDTNARRPQTAKTTEELLMSVPGYKPPAAAAAPVEGEAAEAQSPTKIISVLPDFNTSLEKVMKSGNDNFRQEQYAQVMSIKNRLSNDGYPIDLHKLQRAILMPEEEMVTLNECKYPDPTIDLMKNPFPKAKAKKGKKKKR